jgi:hypothetical protein
MEHVMALKIKASSFFIAHYLKLTERGVVFMETAAIGGKHKFDYGEIDLILLSPTNVLSFQVGGRVFSIPTRPDKPAHRQVIDELVKMVARTQQRTAGFPVMPVR